MIAEQTQAPYVTSPIVLRELDMGVIEVRLARARHALQEVQDYLTDQTVGPAPIELWQVNAALADLENATSKAQEKARRGLRDGTLAALENAANNHAMVCKQLGRLAACVMDAGIRDRLLALAEYEGE